MGFTMAEKNKDGLDIAHLQENLERACDELDRLTSKNYAASSSRRRNG